MKQAVVFVDDRARAQARGGRVKQQRALFRRPPQVWDTFALPGELVVDLFAGGGGASTGIEAALGRPVDIAIDHDPEAISGRSIRARYAARGQSGSRGFRQIAFTFHAPEARRPSRRRSAASPGLLFAGRRRCDRA